MTLFYTVILKRGNPNALNVNPFQWLRICKGVKVLKPVQHHIPALGPNQCDYSFFSQSIKSEGFKVALNSLKEKQSLRYWYRSPGLLRSGRVVLNPAA